MIRTLKHVLLPKTLKAQELNKLEDLYYYNYKYLTNPIGSPYTDNEVKKAIKIINDCIINARFNAEVDLRTY